jgi:hypothetical protein
VSAKPVKDVLRALLDLVGMRRLAVEGHDATVFKAMIEAP